MRCQFVDADGVMCSSESAIMVDRFPRCAQHKRTRKSWENVQRRRVARARDRGILTQTEALFYAEMKMESSMREWGYWRGGQNATGPWDHWTEEARVHRSEVSEVDLHLVTGVSGRVMSSESCMGSGGPCFCCRDWTS